MLIETTLNGILLTLLVSGVLTTLLSAVFIDILVTHDRWDFERDGFIGACVRKMYGV